MKKLIKLAILGLIIYTSWYLYDSGKGYEIYQELDAIKVFGLSTGVVVVFIIRIIVLDYVKKLAKEVDPADVTKLLGLLQLQDKLIKKSDKTKSGKELLEIGNKRAETQRLIASFDKKVFRAVQEVLNNESE